MHVALVRMPRFNLGTVEFLVSAYLLSFDDTIETTRDGIVRYYYYLRLLKLDDHFLWFWALRPHQMQVLALW